MFGISSGDVGAHPDHVASIQFDVFSNLRINLRSQIVFHLLSSFRNLFRYRFRMESILIIVLPQFYGCGIDLSAFLLQLNFKVTL